MALLSLTRLVLWAALCLFGLLAMALSAALIAKTNSDFSGYYKSSVVILFAGIMTLVLAPVYVAASIMHHLTHWAFEISVELGIVFVLWALFLGGAAALASDYSTLSPFCSGIYVSDGLFGQTIALGNMCSLIRATEAFGWLCWIVLSVILALLIVSAVRAHRITGNTHSVMEGSGRATSATESLPMRSVS